MLCHPGTHRLNPLFSWLIILVLLHDCQTGTFNRPGCSTRCIPSLISEPGGSILYGYSSSTTYRIKLNSSNYRVIISQQSWRHRRLAERWPPLKSINRNPTWLVI